MPLISSRFHPHPLLRNGHLQTIVPTLIGRSAQVVYDRERIATPDGDFLDLDWARIGARRIAVLSHGLEGSSDRWYMRGMAAALNANGWDALPWNFRGCSGEMNRTRRFYHSGATDDLQIVLDHLFAQDRYDEVILIGFSLGGNLTLKYLGEMGERLDRRITRSILFSVPCDLRSSAYALARRSNSIYMKRFLRTLKEKVLRKKEVMPDQIDSSGIETIRTFQEFDDRYTAPLHGFRDADDYWTRCSSRSFLGSITIPTLIVNALDDPFLADECYPYDDAEANPMISLETPASGGHVGFFGSGAKNRYWMERRALEFLASR